MKKLKKITALLLSVLMVLSMSVSAFAADVNSWWNTSLNPREVEGEDIVYIGMYNYFRLQNGNNPVTVVGKTVYSGGNMQGNWGWRNDSTIYVYPTNESTASFTHTDDNGVQTVLNVRAVNPHYDLINDNNTDEVYLSRVGMDTEDDILKLKKGESIVVGLAFEGDYENMGRIKDDGSIRQRLTSSDENVVSIEMGHLDSGNTFWNATLTAVGEAGEVSYVRFQNGPIDWKFAVKVINEDGSEPAAPAYTWYMSSNNTIPENAAVEAGDTVRLHICPLVADVADIDNAIEPNRNCVTVLDDSGNDVTSHFAINTSNSNGYPCLRVSPSQEMYGDFTVIYEDVVGGIDLSLPLYVEAYVAPLTEGYAWVDENGNEITSINVAVGEPVTVGFKNLETGEIVQVSGSSHNSNPDHYTCEGNKETKYITYTFHTNVFDDGSNVFEVIATRADGVKVEFPLNFVVGNSEGSNLKWWNTGRSKYEVNGTDVIYAGMKNRFEVRDGDTAVDLADRIAVESGINCELSVEGSKLFIYPTETGRATISYTDDDGNKTMLNVEAVDAHYELVDENGNILLSRVNDDKNNDVLKLKKGESVTVQVKFDGYENVIAFPNNDGSLGYKLKNSNASTVSAELSGIDDEGAYWSATLTAVGEPGDISEFTYQNGTCIVWKFAVKVVNEDGSEPAAPAYTWYMSHNNTIPENAAVEADENLLVHICPLVDGAADMANVIEPNSDCVTVLDASGNDVTSKFDVSKGGSNGYPCLYVCPNKEVYGDFTVIYEDEVGGIDLRLPLHVDPYVAPLTEGYAWVDENGNEITSINVVVGEPVTVGFKNLETGEIVRVSGSSHNSNPDHYTRERNKETNFTTYTFHTNVFDDGSNKFIATVVRVYDGSDVKVDFPLTFIVGEKAGSNLKWWNTGRSKYEVNGTDVIYAGMNNRFEVRDGNTAVDLANRIVLESGINCELSVEGSKLFIYPTETGRATISYTDDDGNKTMLNVEAVDAHYELVDENGNILLSRVNDDKNNDVLKLKKGESVTVQVKFDGYENVIAFPNNDGSLGYKLKNSNASTVSAELSGIDNEGAYWSATLTAVGEPGDISEFTYQNGTCIVWKFAVKVVNEDGSEPAAPAYTWYMSNNNTIPENAAVEAGDTVRLHICPLVADVADIDNAIEPNRDCVTVLDDSGNDVTSHFAINTSNSNGYPCLRVSPSQEMYGDFTIIYEDEVGGIDLSLPLYVEAYVAPLTEGYAWVDENGNEITSINVVVGEPVTVGFKNLETGEIVRVSGSSHNSNPDHYTRENNGETKYTTYTFHTNVFDDGSNVFEVVALSANGVKVEFPLNFVVNEKADAVVGDANGDGELNSADVNLLYRAVMGYIDLEDTTLADVNGDGELNSADVNLLYRVVMGYIDL